VAHKQQGRLEEQFEDVWRALTSETLHPLDVVSRQITGMECRCLLQGYRELSNVYGGGVMRVAAGRYELNPQNLKPQTQHLEQ
jgi:hypothetical protein